MWIDMSWQREEKTTSGMTDQQVKQNKHQTDERKGTVVC
uniref:Uncharacterized protein n=1 Tax=Arundo donax TaxID=35708 RepID=A0A0A9C854_ARUDO